MLEKANPADNRELSEERIDDQVVASEAVDEQREESSIVAGAYANKGAVPPMQEFDVYIRPQEPNIGLYVRAGTPTPYLVASREFFLSSGGRGRTLFAIRTRDQAERPRLSTSELNL